MSERRVVRGLWDVIVASPRFITTPLMRRLLLGVKARAEGAR